MKRLLCLLLSAALLCALCACGKPLHYAITEDSVALAPDRFTTYTNPADSGDAYQMVELDGKEYLPYGTQKGSINGDMVGECLAYQRKDDNIRYYEVIGSDDFIAEYMVNGVMEQFYFLRDANTIGEQIDVPNFIQSQDYPIWE